MKNAFQVVACIFVLILLAGCGGNDQGQKKENQTIAKGERNYGGVFKFNETEYFRSLFPQNVTEVVGHRVTNQVYEGLVQLNQASLKTEPCIAERWEANEDATSFTFYLRKNVYFHDDECFEGGKGRVVTAHDFKYIFNQLCTPKSDNQGFWIFENLVEGANEHYADPSESGVSGVVVIDDHTLQINLVRSFASFLHRLAMPFAQVYPKEAYEKYGQEMREKCVGTGPFLVNSLRSDEAVFLKRNPNYWDTDEFGNQLPYLDGIKVTFIKEEKVEFLEFKNGNIDMKYRLPLEMVNEIMDKDGNLKPDYTEFQKQEGQELTLQYYGFQHKDDVFKNKDLRKAFNYAVDRRKIVDFTMKGEGTPANSGIVPPGMFGYDASKVKGYKFDPSKAKEHLAKAGYANGAGLEEVTLQINSGGGRNEKVAEAVQKMINENLNINVNIVQLPFAQHLENVETGKCYFWRAGWVADYPDAENFLNLLYGPNVPETMAEKSYLNSCRYQSAEFDAIFEKALATIDDDERNALFEKADQIAMDDAAMLPIFYSKNTRLLQPSVRNFPQNAMEYRNFREVYFSN